MDNPPPPIGEWPREGVRLKQPHRFQSLCCCVVRSSWVFLPGWTWTGIHRWTSEGSAQVWGARLHGHLEKKQTKTTTFSLFFSSKISFFSVFVFVIFYIEEENFNQKKKKLFLFVCDSELSCVVVCASMCSFENSFGSIWENNWNTWWKSVESDKCQWLGRVMIERIR